MSDTYEVQGFELRPRFYRNERGIDFVEISSVGGRDTVIHKVGPDIMKRFPAAWEAYTQGKEMPLRKGTSLTDLIEITPELAKTLIERGVHNLEEMASLSDAQCQGLGQGILNRRREANELLMNRKAAERTRLMDAMSEANAPVSAPSGEVAALSAKVDTLTAQLQALVGAMTAAAPKRRKKNGAESAPDRH